MVEIVVVVGGGYDLIVGFWGHEEVLFPCQIAPRFNIQYCTSKYSMKEQPIWYVVIVLLAPNNIFQTLDGGGAIVRVSDSKYWGPPI